MNLLKENQERRFQIVAGRNTSGLASRIANQFGTTLSRVAVFQFNDGEIQPAYEDDNSDSDLYIIQSTNAPADNFQELLLLIDAAKRASVKSITAIIPYFGYSRQYQMDRPGIPVTAELHARLLSAAGVNQIITLDLHSEKIKRFFKVPVVHLHSIELFSSYIKTLKLENLTFGAKRLSRAALAEKYAMLFDNSFVVFNKSKPGSAIEEKLIIGQVEGRNVILVEDIIDSARSTCQAARIIMDQGAASVRAIATHPLLSGDAYDYIESSDLVELVVTDSLPLRHFSRKIKVISSVVLFAEAINCLKEE